MEIITKSDIHCYETLAGTWRAYVRRNHPAYSLVPNVWGFDEQDAFRKMRFVLSNTNFPFDLSK